MSYPYLTAVAIGEGTIVGALSLVNRNLDPWTIYAGVPARAIRERSRRLLAFEGRADEGR